MTPKTLASEGESSKLNAGDTLSSEDSNGDGDGIRHARIGSVEHERSSKNILDHSTVNVRQSKVASCVSVSESFVIQTELVE